MTPTRHRTIQCLAVAQTFLAVLFFCAQPCRGNVESVCGKKFRVATHIIPPFIKVDEKFCTDQKCPPEAFGNDGGLTYEYVMVHLKPKLEEICALEGAANPTVEFEWYLPPSLKFDPESATEMVCQGRFDINPQNIPRTVEVDKNRCPSAAGYRGASPIGSCNFVGDSSCVSPGPDMAAGAIFIVQESLDLLQFTTPYYRLSQVTVKRRDPEPSRVEGLINIFRPFTPALWFAIFLEGVVVWVLFMIAEAPYNQIYIEPGWDAFYDTWYFVWSALLGGADKDSVTVGGKMLFVAHLFFSVIISATYTGSIAAFLTSQASAAAVGDFDSLAFGPYTVTVKGPAWDSRSREPLFYGDYLGGSADTTITQSVQFKMLQMVMLSNPRANFKIFTAPTLDTYRPDGQTRIDSTLFTDPCSIDDAQLGVFDMVACDKDQAGSPKGTGPHATIMDLPLAIYNLNGRYERTRRCDLVTVGRDFATGGYGLGFPYTSDFSFFFSRAILGLEDSGAIETYKKDYQLNEASLQCREEEKEGGEQLNFENTSGLFVITGFVMLCGAVQHFFYKRGRISEASAKYAAEEARIDKIRRLYGDKVADVQLAKLNKRKQDEEDALEAMRVGEEEEEEEDGSVEYVEEWPEQEEDLQEMIDQISKTLAKVEKIADKVEI